MVRLTRAIMRKASRYRAAVVLTVLLGPCIVAFPREIRIVGAGDVEQVNAPAWERVEPYFDSNSYVRAEMGARWRDLYVVHDWPAAIARTVAMVPVAAAVWVALGARRGWGAKGPRGVAGVAASPGRKRRSRLILIGAAVGIAVAIWLGVLIGYGVGAEAAKEEARLKDMRETDDTAGDDEIDRFLNGEIDTLFGE